MKKSEFRTLLHGGSSLPILVGLVNIASPELIEVAAHVGYDAVVIDAEHGALSAADIQEMIRAADASNVAALVRVPLVSRDFVLRSLDSGAVGIVAPDVRCRSDATEAVRQSKYPPQGRRGVAFYSRAYRYTLDSGPAALTAANEVVTVGVQIESRAGVENAEEIMRTPGVDFVLVGPSDMSVDIGSSLDEQDPYVQQTLRDLGALGGRLKIPMATRAPSADVLPSYLANGYRVFFSGLVGQLVKASRAYVGAARSI